VIQRLEAGAWHWFQLLYVDLSGPDSHGVPPYYGFGKEWNKYKVYFLTVFMIALIGLDFALWYVIIVQPGTHLCRSGTGSQVYHCG
jgi:hypothetical protein